VTGMCLARQYFTTGKCEALKRGHIHIFVHRLHRLFNVKKQCPKPHKNLKKPPDIGRSNFVAEKLPGNPSPVSRPVVVFGTVESSVAAAAGSTHSHQRRRHHAPRCALQLPGFQKRRPHRSRYHLIGAAFQFEKYYKYNYHIYIYSTCIYMYMYCIYICVCVTPNPAGCILFQECL
jgi:hypothetical protein